MNNYKVEDKEEYEKLKQLNEKLDKLCDYDKKNNVETDEKEIGEGER